MQPYFFPYLGYWQLVAAVDKYVVYDDVNFIKGGWINRNNILLGGKSHMITLPLGKASPFKKIMEICVLGNTKMVQKVYKTIECAYKRAPYFDAVAPIIRELLAANDNIATLNFNTIRAINAYLGIKTELLLSSQIEKDNTLKGQDKVIHICKILGADTYCNAIGGMELYDRTVFQENGIELKFIKMGDVSYRQFGNEFVPYLSIIDVLMFNSPQEVLRHLSNFTFK